MTTDMINNSQRTAAKVAGVAGLLAFFLVVFGNYVLLEPLVVARNAADTARNILAHQTQFRVALICFITYGIGAIVLLSALYVIFAPVNRGLALACPSSVWPPLFARGCGLSRTTSRKDCRSLA